VASGRLVENNPRRGRWLETFHLVTDRYLDIEARYGFAPRMAARLGLVQLCNRLLLGLARYGYRPRVIVASATRRTARP
jgi:hypothetical protein